MPNKFVSFFGGLRKVAKVAAPIGIQFVSHGLIPPSETDAILTALKLPHGDDSPMNPLEQFAITMVLGILQQTVKNPAHKAALKNQLVGIANLIYFDYGMMPPLPDMQVPVAAAPAVAGAAAPADPVAH